MLLAKILFRNLSFGGCRNQSFHVISRAREIHLMKGICCHPTVHFVVSVCVASHPLLHGTDPPFNPYHQPLRLYRLQPSPSSCLSLSPCSPLSAGCCCGNDPLSVEAHPPSSAPSSEPSSSPSETPSSLPSLETSSSPAAINRRRRLRNHRARPQRRIRSHCQYIIDILLLSFVLLCSVIDVLIDTSGGSDEFDLTARISLILCYYHLYSCVLSLTFSLILPAAATNSISLPVYH
jgi:hypothetical protein